jgi:hypothetical protein
MEDSSRRPCASCIRRKSQVQSRSLRRAQAIGKPLSYSPLAYVNIYARQPRLFCPSIFTFALKTGLGCNTLIGPCQKAYLPLVQVAVDFTLSLNDAINKRVRGWVRKERAESRWIDLSCHIPLRCWLSSLSVKYSSCSAGSRRPSLLRRLASSSGHVSPSRLTAPVPRSTPFSTSLTQQHARKSSAWPSPRALVMSRRVSPS